MDEVRDGDQLEVRGPIGGYFVWDGDEPEPVLLVAGGSGVVPLMAMARHRARVGSETPMRLLYSSRTLGRGHLPRRARDARPRRSCTRSRGSSRRAGRATRGGSTTELLAEVAWPASESPRVYVCGSTRFVDAAADGLVALGYEAGWIRTERFGATG